MFNVMTTIITFVRKEIMACDVPPVAMFNTNIPRKQSAFLAVILIVVV